MTRLFLINDRLDELRRDLTGARAAQARRLYDECERLKGVELFDEHPLASITYLGAGAANLALAHRLTGQEHYLTELRRWLRVAVGYPHWGKAKMPDHDLDAGWLLHGLSHALSWAGDALPGDERAALVEKLTLQGRRLYEFAVESEGQWWSSSYWQNHNWICYAGLAAAGYVLQDDLPEARDWTERAKANFDTVLDALNYDGSNNEGVVYWRYGVPWLVIYLDLLRDNEGIDWFPRSQYLRETFWYRLYQAAPDLERIIDHGDCHDRRSGHPVAMYYKLASEYRIGEAQWLANEVSEKFYWREAYESGVKPGVRMEAYQEFLWFDPTVEPRGIDDVPTQRFFPDLGLVVGRTGWDHDAVMVSFKAAPGGGHKAWRLSHSIDKEKGYRTSLNAGHHHPDSGTFVLLGHGSYLAVDEGYSSNKKTAHHNGVLVDGQGFVREDVYNVFHLLDESHTAEILTTTLEDGWTHAVSEIGAMYDPALGIESMRRAIVLTPAGRLVIVDELASEVPRTWTWLLHTDNPARPEATGWITEAGPGAMKVHVLDDVPTRNEVVPTAVQANPTSSTPSLSIEKVQHTIRRHTEPTSTVRLITVLEPYDATTRPTAVVSLVEASESGVVVQVDGERIALGTDGSDASTLLGKPADVSGRWFAAAGA